MKRCDRPPRSMHETFDRLANAEMQSDAVRCSQMQRSIFLALPRSWMTSVSWEPWELNLARRCGKQKRIVWDDGVKAEREQDRRGVKEAANVARSIESCVSCACFQPLSKAVVMDGLREKLLEDSFVQRHVAAAVVPFWRRSVDRCEHMRPNKS